MRARTLSLSTIITSAALTANPVRPLSVCGGTAPTAGPGGAAISRPMIRTLSSPSMRASSTTTRSNDPEPLVPLAGMVMLNLFTAA